MEYAGHEINIAGLSELLSNINIWSEKEEDRKVNYKREVIQKSGRIFTIIETKGARTK